MTQPSLWAVRRRIQVIHLLSFCGLLFTFGYAQDEVAITNNAAVLETLQGADIIYLAERHDSRADHLAQLQIMGHLRRQGQDSDMAIGLEMVQRPFQNVLDRYIAGSISEAELRQGVEYDVRWGFDWSLYAPVFRFAKIYQIPLVALNTPTEVTRKVAFEGLDSLSEDDLRYIPPVPDIDLTNEAYRVAIGEVFGAHGGHGNSEGFENFFAAQVLWDETMAEAVADYHQVNPNTQIIVLAGAGHIHYGYGIPDRVARRVGSDVEQFTVSLSFVPDEGEAPTDYAWTF